MILLKKQTNVTVHSFEKDVIGRFLALDVSFGDSKITLANIYAPNLDSLIFFLHKFHMIESMNYDFKIIGGDCQGLNSM